MPTPDPQPSIVFKTEDGLLTFTFLLGKDPQSPQQEPVVTAEIDLFWEQGSPLDPITVEVRLKPPAQLAYVSEDGSSIEGALWLRPTSDGRLAVMSDLQYGRTELHHLVGVLALFPLTAS